MSDQVYLDREALSRPIDSLAVHDYGVRRICATDVNDDLLPESKFMEALVEQVLGGKGAPRFALLYGIVPLIQRERIVEFEEAVLIARHFFRAVVDELSARLLADHNLSSLTNPLGVNFQTIEYGIDGCNTNQGYQPYNDMQVRDDFVSTKCIHFDAAEPLSTNIYGPCVNLAGGLPVIADAMSYCRDQNLVVTDILQRLEGYPVSFRVPHYQRLVEDYSIAFDVNMETDTPCLVTLNDVFAGGVAHGATAALPIDATLASQRPLWHVAFDYEQLADIDRWYDALNLMAPQPQTERDEKNLIDQRGRLCNRGPLLVRAR